MRKTAEQGLKRATAVRRRLDRKGMDAQQQQQQQRQQRQQRQQEQQQQQAAGSRQQAAGSSSSSSNEKNKIQNQNKDKGRLTPSH